MQELIVRIFIKQMFTIINVNISWFRLSYHKEAQSEIFIKCFRGNTKFWRKVFLLLWDPYSLLFGESLYRNQ